MRQAASTGAIGMEIALALAIGYFGGKYLDGKLGTAPWLSWLGFFAGVGAAIKALVRLVRQFRRESDGGAP